MIIIDFIDMTSRVDKLAIMEELELAIEDDKAKPQVGQLSDLGLVEMTRHRQGQAISEVFAKKCPHCHGEGYIVEDFKFASPTSEGEYRAKAAKMKLPVSGFKKNNNKKQNNNNNNQNNNQQAPQELEQSQPIEMTTENPSVTAQEENKKRNDKKRPNNKRNFNKKQLNEDANVKVAETMITSEDEIKPVIVEQPQPAVAEEAPVEQPAEETPKKTRRPNRGTKKKRQTRAKKATSEEKVEE